MSHLIIEVWQSRLACIYWGMEKEEIRGIFRQNWNISFAETLLFIEKRRLYQHVSASFTRLKQIFLIHNGIESLDPGKSNCRILKEFADVIVKLLSIISENGNVLQL